MAADYRKLVPFMLRWEGGKSKDSVDTASRSLPVGAVHTNKGVIWPTYQTLAPVLGLNPDYYQGFLNLTDSQAAMFVKHYWNKSTYNNRINSQKIAEAITTWRWGSGAKIIPSFQRLINEKFNAGIQVDGGIGPKTIAAINKINPDNLFKAMLIERARYFVAITVSNPSQLKFLVGWMNRLRAFAGKHGYNLDKLQDGAAKVGGAIVIATCSFFLLRQFLKVNNALPV